MLPIAELFKKSPFSILKTHSSKVHECVKLLPQLFECVSKGECEKQKEIADTIFRLETDADNLKNLLREQLSTSVLLPIRKDDLFDMLEHQDSLADCAEEIAAIMSYRNLRLPDTLSEEVKKYINEVMRNCTLAEGIMSKLDLLEEASFSGLDAITVSKLITELSEREDHIKPEQIEVTRKILNALPPLDPVESILWMQIISLFAQISKNAESVGNALRLSLKIKV
ncbi:MAG: TIGR00153 family protein [Verrucomicrobiia bacterium]|jgi:predicted phosphate transport protein (TIGR00153 family)